MIESIKEFLKQQNLNWTGNISKGMDFYPADEQDFKDLEIIEFLISFGADGMMALSVEIDCANFNILGIFNDYWFEKDASEKFKELGKARDLSQEWINFQINKKGLLYAVKLRDYCLKNKKIITEHYEDKERILQERIKNIQKNKEEKIQYFNDLENKVSMF